MPKKKADPLTELDTTDPKPDVVKPDKVKPKKARRRSGKGATYAQIQEGLESFVTMIGVGVRMAGDEYCGDRILTQGPALTDSLVELSKQNPNVKRMLASLSQTSVWGGVIIASASLVLPIMAHHGLVPAPIASLMGAPLDGMEMESGGTRNPDWPDRTGKDDTSEINTPEADVLTGTSV